MLKTKEFCLDFNRKILPRFSSIVFFPVQYQTEPLASCKWPSVTFEIQLREAIRENPHKIMFFRLKFKWNSFVLRSASTLYLQLRYHLKVSKVYFNERLRNLSINVIFGPFDSK